MADRLSVSNDIIEGLVNNIDKVNMLGMRKGSIDRSELISFAMALGVAKGVRTPLRQRKGFSQSSSFQNKPFESYIYSVALNDLKKENSENLISDTDVVYKIVEEYAQTGFDEIQKMFGDFSDYSEEDCIYRMIEFMDDMYEKLKPE